MSRSRALLAALTVGLACAAAAVLASDGPADPGTGRSGPAEAPERAISVWQAAVLGVVEGITEYLPVSSTGHLILTSQAMGMSRLADEPGPLGPRVEADEALSAFEIVIQLGAILAVLGLYRRPVADMCLGLAGRSRRGLRLLSLLVVAFLPAAVLGVLLHGPIKAYLFGPVTVAIALAVGGAVMIGVEHLWWRRRKPGRALVTSVYDVRFWQALVIGGAQVLAMWPGTSRSMVTIVAALVVGLDMVTAAQFSFLLALPTLGGATVYEGVQSREALLDAAGPAGLAVGLVLSALVAAASVKLLLRWLTRHGLTPFGVYRVLLGAAVWWYFFAR